MGRFNPSTYDPADDSSQGRIANRNKRFGKVVVLVKTKPEHCSCGCDEQPGGKHSSFKMGHDARLKGVLIRAHLTNTPVAYDSGSKSVEASALEVADRFGWEGYLVAAEDRQNATPAPKAKPAKKATPSTVKVKIGRWTHDAKVLSFPSAGTVEVEYKTKGGVKIVKVIDRKQVVA